MIFNALACLLFQGFLFLYAQKNWYFNNEYTPTYHDMALHFSHFHHHIELFGFLIHMISERIHLFNTK